MPRDALPPGLPWPAAVSASNRTDKGERLRDLIPGFILAFAGLCAMVGVTVFRLPADGTVAALFPVGASPDSPWTRLAGTDALVLGQAFGGRVLILRPASGVPLPAPAQLGAWLYLNPKALALCGGDDEAFLMHEPQPSWREPQKTDDSGRPI